MNALGFFETVEITTKPGSAEDTIVAMVEVKERATGTFQIGAGFSSYENFILTGQISQNNFFGWGQTLSLQVQWSSIRQLGQIQFVEPYFLDTRWTFAFDLYATEGIYTTFTRRSVGGSMTWGYELTGLAPGGRFARQPRGHAALRDVHERAGGRLGAASSDRSRTSSSRARRARSGCPCSGTSATTGSSRRGASSSPRSREVAPPSSRRARSSATR